MKNFTAVVEETPAANLVGARPVPRGFAPNHAACLLERMSDGRMFLLLKPTTDKQTVTAWADARIAEIAEEAR